tara:strand:- start:340 stop:573 length:234 start_codon:yes stop_codon:yes gene_type:complete
METLVSKVTTKGQATIPLRVRKMLGLKSGDAVAFRVEGKQVALSKARPLDLAFAQATEKTLAAEWSSKHDDDAYADL